jgi:hypothetical protein
MSISPDEAEEALASIQKMTIKTRHSIANSGATIFLIFTGIIWLVGFLSTQFLTGKIVPSIWIGISLICTVLSVLLGSRSGKRVRGPSTAIYGKRAALFWLALVFFCIATIAVAKPADSKQTTMIIILFMMIGQLSMGLLISFSAVWWALPISALTLAGYFLFPNIFYLWMGVLVGGGMIILGLYIRSRW